MVAQAPAFSLFEKDPADALNDENILVLRDGEAVRMFEFPAGLAGIQFAVEALPGQEVKAIWATFQAWQEEQGAAEQEEAASE